MPPLIARIEKKVNFTEDGCWLWTGAVARGGYGKIGVAGRHLVAHRVLYELIVDAVPANVELHHLCGNKACVNPDHLEPLVRAEHEARHRKTHCVNGHALPLVTGPGKRHCKTCNRDRQRARRAKEKI
jgi:hypothetical protein